MNNQDVVIIDDIARIGEILEKIQPLQKPMSTSVLATHAFLLITAQTF
ncbi:MAG: hypoxanthine-guanine phosphoribosyltransferase [Colwellia sp.]|jgi:hypoxanthine-guanine phosphoribosyltransferase